MKPHTCTPPNCFGCHIKSIQLRSGQNGDIPHFNYSVGKYVNNDRQYRDELKKAAERNSIATGITHSYEPRYPGETSPIREADQVFDDTARNLRKLSGE